MSEWISVKKQLPQENTIVKIKMNSLFIPIEAKERIRALYLKGYFNFQGQNATPWVTHWKPLPQEDDNVNQDK